MLKSAKGAKNKKGPAPQISMKAQNIGAHDQIGRMPSTNRTMSQLLAALLPTIEKMPSPSSGIPQVEAWPAAARPLFFVWQIWLLAQLILSHAAWYS